MFLRFLNDFFSPKLGRYKNFKFNERSFVSFKVIIAGIFFGVLLACICAIYNKRVLGGFVRKVIAKGALSKEGALTLEELGYSKNPFVKYSLLHGNTLKRAVACVEREEYLEKLGENTESESDDESGKKKKKALIRADFKPDSKTAHFYIPEEKRYALEERFNKKGTNLFVFFITFIIMAVGTLFLVHYLPNILTFIDKLIG